MSGNTNPHMEYASSKTGFLTKRAMSSLDAFANWKERFFVLAEGRLSYYKQGGGFFNSTKEEIAHLKGDLELTPDSRVQRTRVDERANCFEVATPTKKMYAQASTIKEMEDWIKAINAHIAFLQRSDRVRKGSFTGSASGVPASGSRTPSHGPTSAASGGDTSPLGGYVKSPVADYSRPSLLESNDIVKSAESSSDPKDVVIVQLLEENRQLREQLTAKDQIIQQLEANASSSIEGSMSMSKGRGGRFNSPQAILDLRNVRKKQIQLFDAAELGNAQLIATLLRDNVVDVNSVGVNQTTALHLAAKSGHVAAVKELLSRGADSSARTADSFTPLMLAAQGGNTECVNELLKSGADPNPTDQAGNAAIHMAAEVGSIGTAKALLAYGARADVPNSSGSLPVHLSPIGHPIRVLLGSGSNLAATNPKQPPKKITNKAEGEAPHLAFVNKYQKDLALGPRDFEFIKVLGRGAFAKVYLVRGKGSNRDKWFALKAYNKQAIVQKNQAQYIHTEKAALQACSDHPYIVTLYYAFQSKDRLFLVMDYCGGGDLLSALTRKKSFSEEDAAFYIAEITLALSHLHKKNIVFRDLKPENVVLDLEGHCLLTDFGISKEGIKDHTSANTFCGSPMYLAPEMLSRSGHGFALDWYSVGALLFELLTGLPPFYTNDKKQLFHNILRGQLVIPEYLSETARDLITRLLMRDPKKRLGSGPDGDKEIMDHPFFAKIDWEKLMRRELSPPYKPKFDGHGKDIPDTSNFPQAFTDQVISDTEKGIDGSSSSLKGSMKEDKKLFQDFDFTPEPQLDSEAMKFEELALQNSIKDQAPPALIESEEDEYNL